MRCNAIESEAIAQTKDAGGGGEKLLFNSTYKNRLSVRVFFGKCEMVFIQKIVKITAILRIVDFLVAAEHSRAMDKRK